MADDDDVVYPLIGNDDLIATGLVPKDDDDIRDDTAALLGIDVGSGSAPIDLDGGDGGGGVEPTLSTTATGTPVGSNSIVHTMLMSKLNCINYLINMGASLVQLGLKGLHNHHIIQASLDFDPVNV